MNLFDKIAIDLDTLHKITKLKENKIKKKLGRDPFIDKDLSELYGVSNLIESTHKDNLMGPVTTSTTQSPKLKHVLPSIFIGKNSYDVVKIPNNASGKVKKARNLLTRNHEMDELIEGHFNNFSSPSVNSKYGHNSITGILTKEHNIIATGDKNIKAGGQYLVDFRRKNEQKHIKKLLNYIDPEKAENFQFGDPNSRLNRHTLRKMRDYEKILSTQEWKPTIKDVDLEAAEKYLKDFDSSGKTFNKYKNMVKHMKYVIDNLDMDRFTKDKKYRHDIIKHTDKANKHLSEVQNVVTTDNYFKNLVNNHTGSYAKSNVAPPIPTKSNKTLSAIKTMAQHHL